jgi:hypothetical protein
MDKKTTYTMMDIVERSATLKRDEIDELLEEARPKVKKVIRAMVGHLLFTDRLIEHRKAGTWELQRTFFYRMGGSSEKFAEQAGRLAGVEIVDAHEEWHQWPTTSYWTVTIKVVDAIALLKQWLGILGTVPEDEE